MAVDANADEEARRVYRSALACAEQAQDWPLRAEVLSSMAKQAIWTGQPDDARSWAVCLAKLASLTMATGDPIQAATIRHAALDIAGTIRSRRAAEELRELARYVATYQHLDEVAHLRHRIATLVCTDSPQGGCDSPPNPPLTYT